MGSALGKAEGNTLLCLSSCGSVEQDILNNNTDKFLEQKANSFWLEEQFDVQHPTQSDPACAGVIRYSKLAVQSPGFASKRDTVKEKLDRQLDTGRSQPKPERPNLMTIVQCCQPLLHEITAYLASSPRSFTRFGGWVSSSLAIASNFKSHPCWSTMYATRWPAFYECLSYHGAADWQTLYYETFIGCLECILEVFDREKKVGFVMSAMNARIQYDMEVDGYMVQYLSACEVTPEIITSEEEHRLRFCPASVRSQLMPEYNLSKSGNDDIGERGCRKQHVSYPYRVLEGIQGLTVGKGVELQWKMQQRSPFGWWYGQLESLLPDPDGVRATAVITFNHFPSTSRWYRLMVRFGGAEMRECLFGGYTGGIRAVSEEEIQNWMRFVPKRKLDF